MVDLLFKNDLKDPAPYLQIKKRVTCGCKTSQTGTWRIRRFPRMTRKEYKKNAVQNLWALMRLLVSGLQPGPGFCLNMTTLAQSIFKSQEVFFPKI